MHTLTPAKRRRVLFSSFDGGQRSRKAAFLCRPPHIPASAPHFLPCQVTARLCLWGFSCQVIAELEKLGDLSKLWAQMRKNNTEEGAPPCKWSEAGRK